MRVPSPDLLVGLNVQLSLLVAGGLPVDESDDDDNDNDEAE